ncbi:hypothetical protein FRC07_002855 [Ceratobasidium sp. 392]|nr:hypothetical protein FRC07_002855 [Ceratobasidium sp. 392]
MSEPQSDESKKLKRPRGLLASRKNAGTNTDSGSSAKKPRADDSLSELDEEALNVQDWEDLKDLFHNAVDVFYGDCPAAALPLVRGVLHECARLVSVHKDPTIIYSPLESSGSNGSLEPACAFYNVYSFSWYIMYTFARTDPSVLTEDEPKEPIAYALSALAACEEGQKALDTRKLERIWDWSVQFEFIRARVLLAAAQAWSNLDENADGGPTSTTLTQDLTRLAGPDPTTMLQRGIDHLSYALDHRPDDSKFGRNYNDEKQMFARSLLDAAQVVLTIVESLDQDTEQEGSNPKIKYLFSARKFFSEVVAQHNISTNVRTQGIFGEAQAELAIGATIAEGLEENEEDGEKISDKENLRKEAVTSLKSGEFAIEKFDEARKLSCDADKKPHIDEEEIKPLLQEALVTLATLLPEGPEQEAMYARYREEGGVLEDDEESEAEK